MIQVQRLLGFLRPYTLRFAAAILLMAVVGACEALMALLIRPVFDRVFVNAGSGPILLLSGPSRGAWFTCKTSCRATFTTCGRWSLWPSLRSCWRKGSPNS